MQSAKRIAVSVLIVVGLGLAAQGIAQDIKFNPIQPTSNQPLTDEQQGILAVRKAKASVVNILGTPVPTTTPGIAASSPAADGNGGVAGTGFIISADGLIVTNNHVVSDSGYSYSVTLADGTSYPATILGQDKFDDIALIKISATGLTPADLGDSSSLETGQTVFAIGNALGQYQDTVTRGVVSGLQRGINETGDSSSPTTHNWIQTDASINLGNSGGPLINSNGQVIGMDTLIDPEGDSLGFAIPINTIKDAVQQLQTFGVVSRPFLGVKFTTITPQTPAQGNASLQNGALISSVLAGSPADTAGVLYGDIVIAVNNQKLTQLEALDQIIQSYNAGSQITLKILRNGNEIDLPVVLGSQK